MFSSAAQLQVLIGVIPSAPQEYLTVYYTERRHVYTHN